MTRLVVHAGFHKTGTKSVQAALADNRALLAGHVQIFLRADMQDVADAARHYSECPDAVKLGDFARDMAEFFRMAPVRDGRSIVISAEDLSGLLPGRTGLAPYAAVPDLIAAVEAAARDGLWPGVDVTFLFSTRDRQAWIDSVWWQNLRMMRLTMDVDEHRLHAADWPDLDQILQRTRDAVAAATVMSVRLEDTARLPQGPVTPILDLCEIPSSVREEMILPAIRNTRPAGGLEPVFLALNRSGLPDRVVTDAKTKLFNAARRNERETKENPGAEPAVPKPSGKA